jgi:medium-chain acyl-[acyl-carrier-protein] hydrolase
MDRVNSREPSAADWFVPLNDVADARVHVYALPQAGAGCATFAECADLLGPDIAVWGLNLPGRQARFTEPSRTDLLPLLGDLAAATGRHKPWVLFGYCSGALQAFLLARMLRDAPVPPAGLVVASYAAPDLVRPPRRLHTLPTDLFWHQVLEDGGVPPAVAAQPDFRDIFEGSLRADYALLADYHYADEAPLDIPITVLVGDRDPVLSREDITGWPRHTTASCRIRRLPGGHWLLADAQLPLADALREAVR